MPEEHPVYKLGRRPPKNAPALRFASFWTGQVPTHPAAADHFAKVSDWGLWGNDAAGDCGPVSVGNLLKLVTGYLSGQEFSVSQDDVYDLYRRSGNPNFDPNDPGGPGDQGVDMQTMCEALLAGGIAGRKPLGFAKVDVSNLDELRAAIAIFGGLLYGVDLEVAQQQQTDRGLWDYKTSAEWGGHAVLAGLYTSQSGNDVSVVTWAKVVGTTDRFEQQQLQEAWLLIWPEHLGSQGFLEGVDAWALAALYKSITGKDFPAPLPVPEPVPAPPTPTPPEPAPEPQPVWQQALSDALAKLREAITELEQLLVGK